MNLKTKKDLEVYLKPTFYCDSDNEKIITKVNEITQNDNTVKEKALSVFYFVRDEIKFMLNDFMKASEVLERKSGDCGGKSNLQVALLRASQIPARFHIVALNKESLKGVVPRSIYKIMPPTIENHPWCECYLSGNWIACDTLFDKPLVKGLFKKGIYSKQDIPTIDWDGEKDLNTMKNWIINEKDVFTSLDEIIGEVDDEAQDIPEEVKKMLTNKLINHLEKLRNL